MTEKEKAYCGDGIAQLIVGELRAGKKTKIRGILSNKAMAHAYCDMHNIKIQEMKGWSEGAPRSWFHKMGTKFEAQLYDEFKEKGYEEAKRIVEEYLVPLQGDIRLI